MPEEEPLYPDARPRGAGSTPPPARPPIALDYRPAHTRHPALSTARPRWFAAARVLLVVSWLAAFVALAGIPLVHTRSVVVTGPVLLVLGAATAAVGMRAGASAVAAVGAAHGGICLLLFALINLLHWGPDRAKAPALVLGSIHVLLTLFLSARAWRRPPRARPPWECRRCGYLLFGLGQGAGEARCPECGLPFDPARVPEGMPDVVR